MDRYSPGRVLFLGEQDGVVERKLKAKLVGACLENCARVRSAYLVRVSYENSPGVNVALCVRGDENAATTLVECVGARFRELFGATQHLDVLFLSEEQLVAIDRVAKPFYTSA